MASVFDIAVMGTSITTGIYARGWPLFLERALQVGKQSKVRVHALGKEAATSNWGAANLAPLTNIRPRAAFIEFINDAFLPYQGVSPENMSLEKSAANFSAIIAGIRTLSPETEIFLGTLVRPSADGVSLYPELPAYDRQLKMIASAQGVRFVDLRAVWGDPAQHASEYPQGDGVHVYIEAHRRVTIPQLTKVFGHLIK